MHIKPNHKMFSCTVTRWFQPLWLLQSFALSRICSSLKSKSNLSTNQQTSKLVYSFV